VDTVFSKVRPRPEVLSGVLTEAVFAASLNEVVDGTAPAAYGDADLFFATTFPSGGLRTLLNEALGRLGGGKPDGASVLRLETSLGGGKTHNLIALFHAAQGRLSLARAVEFMDPGLLPTKPTHQLGVFVGTSSGATSFPARDGISPHTLWGHLALQVGGRSGYERVRVDDEGLTAPGSSALKELLGDTPALLLIDEIARYYTTARGVLVGSTTLAQQTTSFLMALMEAVDALPHAVLVITTTASSDVFGEGSEEVLRAIAEARELMARKELVLRPSDEGDLPRILARRLFEPVPAGVAARAGSAYAESSDAAYRSGLDLPEGMTGVGWAAQVTNAYPFHPALIAVLDKRMSTIPNFQRTRGALRLLARVVRRLWEEQPESVQLVHLHHIDLGDRTIAEELSSRLERPEFEPVIRADIASRPPAEPSHAQRADERMGGRYASHLATAIYLFSLTRGLPGVRASEVFSAVLTPGDDANLLQKALDELQKSCWYLHADIRGFRFTTEASLVMLVQEAERATSLSKVRAAATQILGDQFKDGPLKVRRAWEDAKVPDNAEDAWLVVLHWDDFGDARGVDPKGPIPSKISQMWERAPAGGLREYRNRLVLLAPALGTHDAMIRTVREHLALRALRDNGDVVSRLSAENRKQLDIRADESSLMARIAVCSHVSVLFVPSASGLEAVQLGTVTKASVAKNQTDAIVERLAAMDKTARAGDSVLDPLFIRTKLGTLLDTPQPTQELVRAFARRSDLRLVLDRAQLVALVLAGVRNGVWEYQDPERDIDGWGTQAEPSISVRLAEDTFLHPPGSAPEAAAALCPFCGTAHPGTTTCPDGAGRDGTDTHRSAGSRFTGGGAAGKAFADARGAAADAGRNTVQELIVEVDHLGEGAGVEMARLHTVVPASTAGAKLTYDVAVEVSMSRPGDIATVRYHGEPADFSALREALKQLLATREATLKASLHATFADPPALSGEAVQRLAQAAGDTGPTRCVITIVTEASA
jgi:hypothetical protein